MWSLYQRYIVQSPLCPRCQAADDTPLHATWSCSFCVAVLERVSFYSKLVSGMLTDFFEFLNHAFKVLTVDEMKLLIIMLWSNWSERNKDSMQSHLSSGGSIIDMAWQPPSPGMLSLNTDASVINNGVNIGVGVVVRNHLGDLVLAGGERVQGRFRPSVAEFLALCKGLEYVVEHNWLLEKVECDCLEAVRVVNDVCECFAEEGILVDRVRVLLVAVGSPKLSHVSRTANGAADVVAKMDSQANISTSSTAKSGRYKEKQPSHTWTPVEDVALVEVHKDAKGLRLKPFIHYDSLVEAFGKDRANGLGAEGLAEVDEDMNNNNEFVDLERDGLCENVVPTSATRTPSAPSSTRTRKRPRDAYTQCLGDMATTLRSFVEVTKTHLETMKEVLLNEHATSTKRGKLVEELMKVEGFDHRNSELNSEITSLLKNDNDEWGKMLQLTSDEDFSLKRAEEQLHQQLLKEKLHAWLLQKLAAGGKGPNCLDQGGQGVLQFGAALGYDWVLLPTITA
ncbi:hypothetical protein ACLB2K_004033 [Fragaria x ananassa]